MKTDINNSNHQLKIKKKQWEEKLVLRKIYKEIFTKIASNVDSSIDGSIIEIGSGLGTLKNELPKCIQSDIFYSTQIELVQNAYELALKDESISHIILFDVFHHLKYPSMALNEFFRVLSQGGRLIIFEPYISILGLLVYGLFHEEPVRWLNTIKLNHKLNLYSDKKRYYAAQGNATRIFNKVKKYNFLNSWNVIHKERMTLLSYVLSGGYSKPQLYPDSFFFAFKHVDKFLNKFPYLFATRLLVVLEKY